MSKLEKVFNVIGWIVVIFALLFIIGFVAMIIMLVRYDECRQGEFESAYCERYKDF